VFVDIETVPPEGALTTGTVGVTELDAEDAADVPFALVAVTVYVRAVPLVSLTDIGLDVPVPVLPEDEVTVNPVIALPPVAPAVNVTDTVPLPAVAVPIVGA
jgi:hypothetical protein